MAALVESPPCVDEIQEPKDLVENDVAEQTEQAKKKKKKKKKKTAGLKFKCHTWKAAESVNDPKNNLAICRVLHDHPQVSSYLCCLILLKLFVILIGIIEN